MRRTLKILYPDDFGKKYKKTLKAGFLRKNLNSLKLYLGNLGKAKLLLGTVAIIGTIMSAYMIYAYNHFTAYTNDYLTAYANIEKEAQRRNDLINNLIPPTLNYLSYEKKLFSYVAEIRRKITDLQGIMEKNGDNKMITGELKTNLPGLLGIFENYPDLKASKPFSDLMKELIETENRVAMARETFNKAVNTYNIYISKIPANMVADILDYKKKAWFEATDNASAVPDMERLNSVNTEDIHSAGD